MVDSGKEGVILVLELVNDGKKPIDKDRAAKTRIQIFKISLARNARFTVSNTNSNIQNSSSS